MSTLEKLASSSGSKDYLPIDSGAKFIKRCWTEVKIKFTTRTPIFDHDSNLMATWIARLCLVLGISWLPLNAFIFRPAERVLVRMPSGSSWITLIPLKTKLLFNSQSIYTEFASCKQIQS